MEWATQKSFMSRKTLLDNLSKDIEIYQNLSNKMWPSTFNDVQLRALGQRLKKMVRKGQLSGKRPKHWKQARKAFGCPTNLQNRLQFEQFFMYYLNHYENYPLRKFYSLTDRIHATCHIGQTDALHQEKDDFSYMILNPAIFHNASIIGYSMSILFHPNSKYFLGNYSKFERVILFDSNPRLLGPLAGLILSIVKHDGSIPNNIDEDLFKSEFILFWNEIENGLVSFIILHEMAHFDERYGEHSYFNITEDYFEFRKLFEIIEKDTNQEKYETSWRLQRDELSADLKAANTILTHEAGVIAIIGPLIWLVINDCIEYMMSLIANKGNIISNLSPKEDCAYSLALRRSHPSPKFRFFCQYNNYKNLRSSFDSGLSPNIREELESISLFGFNCIYDIWSFLKKAIFEYCSEHEYKIEVNEVWEVNSRKNPYPPTWQELIQRE